MYTENWRTFRQGVRSLRAGLDERRGVLKDSVLEGGLKVEAVAEVDEVLRRVRRDLLVAENLAKSFAEEVAVRKAA